jgi:hypothetical protein
MNVKWLPALVLLLAACSDDGVNPILGAVVDEVNPWSSNDDAAPAGGGRRVTRAAINKADVATIRARLLIDSAPSYLFAVSSNGGYVTYATRLRQSLTLRGSQITGSRGLGYDLLSAWSSQPDPLARAIPPKQWPAQVSRSYEFPADSAQGRVENFRCTYEFGEVLDVVILEVRHRGVQVSETCEGETGSFENLHLADVSTGFVWRSLQWLGHQQGLVDMEIVLPYTGR